MGGAAGHMAHPFDLGWVDTGNDLIDFFEKAKTFVEKKGAGAVKIDGVNVSFKVVETPRGHEFAVDRGSLKNIDIDGITMARVDDRFPEGHGMRPAIRTLLTILNTALPSLKPQLEELGMWDDPSRFLNTEYVAGTTNVTQYDENFLAIHGLNQFYQKVAKSGASKGNIRPGASRPEGVKAPSVEVPYDPKIMEKLIEKLNPTANEYGFQVYGSVPTERIGGDEIDFSQTLAEPFTVRISDGREVTKTLKEWLSEVSNPRYKTVKLKSGKSTHPLHKELYKAILNGSPALVDFVEEQDAESAIQGAIIMHATRMLGNDILRGLTSPMGDVMSHEGVVLRDDNLFGLNPVKITGEFILGGMGSAFQDDTALTETEDEDDDPVVDTDFGKTYAIVPGAFKPPHIGHADMVRRYATGDGVPRADEVRVVISAPMNAQRTLKDGTVINEDHAIKLWRDLFPDVANLPNVQFEIAPPTMRSPVTVAYEYVGNKSPLPLKDGDSIMLGASLKDDDWKRWVGADKIKVHPGVKLLSGEEYAVPALTRPDGENFSATTMRELISSLVENPSDAEAYSALTEFVPPDKIDVLFSTLNLPSLGKIDETSSGGGGGGGNSTATGAVGGYAGGVPLGFTSDRAGKRDKKKKRKKASMIREENIDLSIVEEVMRLIIEKDIVQ